MLQLTFNPGLTLTGFRTTRPSCDKRPTFEKTLSPLYFYGEHLTILLIPNSRVSLPHRRSATVSLETQSFKSREKLAEL